MPNKAPAKPKRPLTAAIYHDETKAREHLEALLWKHGPQCPRCSVTGDRITKLQGKSTRPGVYKCKDCRKPFSVTVGTVMERSHIPLTKWVMAADFMANGKKGMSALQLQRHIGTNYETSWFLFHRLRECTPTPSDAGPIGGFNKVVEGDETYVGGKAKNKAFGPPPKKMAVFSLIERKGGVRSFHVPNVNARTLRPIIVKHVSRKSHLMTDEATVYPAIGAEFAGHSTVNHSADEYVRMGGFVTTNSIESFFSLLKRGVYGNFHAVSEQHLARYLREFDWRHNNRDMSPAERADALLAGAKGKRLLYHQPDKTAHA
jgi:transposase-like protein